MSKAKLKECLEDFLVRSFGVPSGSRDPVSAEAAERCRNGDRERSGFGPWHGP